MRVVGADVTTVAPGDCVVLGFDHCGGCANCLAGKPAYCATLKPILRRGG